MHNMHNIYKMFIVIVVSMHCQQPDNSDLFKRHGQRSPGVGLWIELQLGGELPQVGEKAQR